MSKPTTVRELRELLNGFPDEYLDLTTTIKVGSTFRGHTGTYIHTERMGMVVNKYLCFTAGSYTSTIDTAQAELNYLLDNRKTLSVVEGNDQLLLILTEILEVLRNG